MNRETQKILASARNVAEGNPTLGKLIREGKDPMQTKVLFEYAAVLRELIEQYGYFHGEPVVYVNDIEKVINDLETFVIPKSNE